MKDSGPFYNPNFYIITGGPGAGKTTLLHELQNRGCYCVNEVAREIIRGQVLTNGEALPWKDREQYLELMFEHSVDSYKKQEKVGAGIVLFDRGIPDSITYAEIIGSNRLAPMALDAQHFRYNEKVFFLQPWKVIYETDDERKQSWEEAVISANLNVATYQRLGYTIIEVPQGTVSERADFVLENL
jgi:predicted ATPase